MHFDAIWRQLFVGRRTRYICNFAIKIEPICQLQCPRDRTAVLPLLSNEHALKSGTFGVPGLGSCWDAEPHYTNPGHPGKSGTGGNPSSKTTDDQAGDAVRDTRVCCLPHSTDQNNVFSTTTTTIRATPSSDICPLPAREICLSEITIAGTCPSRFKIMI